MGKMTRSDARKALDFMPVEVALMGSAHRELTHKQRTFARELALGSTGADAYRKAYNTKAKVKTQGDQASRMKRNPRIEAETNRQRALIEARKQRTPEELRDWVITQLRAEAEDMDNPPSVRVNALQLLGRVTEVAAFTDRKEKVILHSSLDLRARIEQSIRELTLDAEDVEVVSLEQELRLNSPIESPDDEQRLNDTLRLNSTDDDQDEQERLNTIDSEPDRLNSPDDADPDTPCLNAVDLDPTGPGTPQSGRVDGGGLLHNIPPKQSDPFSQTHPPTNWVPSIPR
jgi:hypothetical protein